MAGGPADGRSTPNWGSPPSPDPRQRRFTPPPGPVPPMPKRAPEQRATRSTSTGQARSKQSQRQAPSRQQPAAGRGQRGTATASRPPRQQPKAAPKRAPKPKQQGTFRARYAVVHDIEGPRVRYGVLWFFTAAVAIIAGPLPTALVYGGVGSAAGLQAARAWRAKGVGASDVMAAGGVGIMTLGSLFGAGGAGLGMIACVALAFVAAAGDNGSPHPRISDIGYTLQCALTPGVTAMCVVLLTRYDQGSAIALLLVASAFECGDFLIGTSARNPYEGPGAGAAAIVVVTFIVSTLPVSALSFGEAWALGGAMVLLGPFGQFLASAVLPSASSPALALRRLDTIIIAAPIWAYVAGMAVGN